MVYWNYHKNSRKKAQVAIENAKESGKYEAKKSAKYLDDFARVFDCTEA